MSDLEGIINNGTRIIASQWELTNVPHYKSLRVDVRLSKVGQGIDESENQIITLVGIDLRFVDQTVDNEDAVAEISVTAANEYERIDQETIEVSEKIRIELLKLSLNQMLREAINEMKRIGKISKVTIPDMSPELFINDAIKTIDDWDVEVSTDQDSKLE